MIAQTENPSAVLLRVEGIYQKGFGIVPKFVMHDPELSLESKALYAYLCALAGGGEHTFPYRETILRQLGLSKNTYYRHYTPLIEQGYIRVDRQGRRDDANIYTLISNPKKLREAPVAAGEGMLRYTGLKSQGYGTIPRAVMTDSRLSIKAKGLYAYFCSYCGAGNSAFPSRDHIIHHLGISEPTYYKALSQLKETDYLRVAQRKEQGRFAVNDYYLNEFPGEGPMAETSPQPRPKNEDMVNTLPRPKNGDTKKRDTKNWDSYISSNSSSSNNSSIDRPREKNRLHDLAGAAFRRIAPEDDGQLLEQFLTEFPNRIRNRDVSNLPAYLNASVRTFLREKAQLQPLSGAMERSYDLSELEHLLERDVFT